MMTSFVLLSRYCRWWEAARGWRSTSSSLSGVSLSAGISLPDCNTFSLWLQLEVWARVRWQSNSYRTSKWTADVAACILSFYWLSPIALFQFRGRVWPDDWGLLPEAGCHRWRDLPAGHPRHSRPGRVQVQKLSKLATLPLRSPPTTDLTFANFQCDEGPVHEDGRGLPARVRRQQRQVIRGHQRLPRANQTGQGCRGSAHGL